MSSLDDHTRVKQIQSIIRRKKSLTKLYFEFYSKYLDCISRSPVGGISLEIGSGAGFLKEIAPRVITSDIIPYKTVDMVMDACRMPFPDSSISSVFMLNTLHHISKTKSFFPELIRCLTPQGRVFIIDQYHGWLSNGIYKYLHHEPYFPDTANWEFETSGPLSGANGALGRIIFYRDRKIFERLYPSLHITQRTPHTPFRYWFSGGLKSWCLLPESLFKLLTKLDNWVAKEFPNTCSFMDIELVKNID